MATAAQIEANRINAQKSTGPKTKRGKSRARLNSLKHGMSATTVFPVLPHEDPRQLEERTQQFLNDLQPRNEFERELILRAARLSFAIDRADRVETAHLAHRVRIAARSETVSARRIKKVHDLGRKLFLDCATGTASYLAESNGENEPAVIVRGLEESVEGCQWLLERWGELHHILDCDASWTDPEMHRFIALLGKRGLEAIFDQELNSLFQAFDFFGHSFGQEYWKACIEEVPLNDPGGFVCKPWRELGPRPRDKAEALSRIRAIMDEHVGRLKELLVEHEEIEADEAAEHCDRAALDCSKEFERHRRYQSAKTRELLRTLDMLQKMRKTGFGVGNGEAGMVNDKWQMADGKCRMANDKGKVRSGGEVGEQTLELSQGPIMGYDSNRVMENSKIDKIGILSHDGREAADRQSQEASIRQGAACELERTEKAPIEPKTKSTQSSVLLTVKSSTTEPAGEERSQSMQTVASSGRTVADESAGNGERRVAGEEKDVNDVQSRRPEGDNSPHISLHSQGGK